VGAAAIPFPFYPRHLTVVSTLTIGVPGFFLALAAGAPRARPGFTRRVLAFTIPAGIAAAAATLGAYALARVADGTTAQGARTAAMLALLAVGLWVLVIVADRAAWRIALVAAMAACVVPLLAIPLARRVFAVQLPPAGVLLQVAAVVLVAIAGLTLWRRLRPPA
jgi:cation-transporting ATPase E